MDENHIHHLQALPSSEPHSPVFPGCNLWEFVVQWWNLYGWKLLPAKWDENLTSLTLWWLSGWIDQPDQGLHRSKDLNTKGSLFGNREILRKPLWTYLLDILCLHLQYEYSLATCFRWEETSPAMMKRTWWTHKMVLGFCCNIHQFNAQIMYSSNFGRDARPH